MMLGAEHGNVSAIGMSDQGQMIVDGIGLQFFQFPKHKQNVGFAFFMYSAPADVAQSDLGHQWRIGRKILLNAGNQIAPCCKDRNEYFVFLTVLPLLMIAIGSFQ